MEHFQVIQQGGRPIKAWIDGVDLDDAARQQLINVASLPFIHEHIAAMPDVHWDWAPPSVRSSRHRVPSFQPLSAWILAVA